MTPIAKPNVTASAAEIATFCKVEDVGGVFAGCRMRHKLIAISDGGKTTVRGISPMRQDASNAATNTTITARPDPAFAGSGYGGSRRRLWVLVPMILSDSTRSLSHSRAVTAPKARIGDDAAVAHGGH